MIVKVCARPWHEDARASATRCRHLTIFLIAEGEKGRIRRKSTILESVFFIAAPFARHFGSRIACNREIRNSFNVTENKENEETAREKEKNLGYVVFPLSLAAAGVSGLWKFRDRPARCLASGAGGNARGKETGERYKKRRAKGKEINGLKNDNCLKQLKK